MTKANLARPKLVGPIKLSRQSARLYRDHLKPIAALTGIVGVPVSFLGAKVGDATSLGANFFSFIATVLTLMLNLALVWMVIKIVQGHKPGWRESYASSSPFFLPFVGATILETIILVAGGLALIVPGVVFAVWFSLASFAVVEAGLMPIAALKRSRQMVKGYFWPTLGRLAILISVLLVALFAISIITALVLHTTTDNWLIRGSLQLAYLMVYLPLSLFYTFLIYQELHEVKRS